MKKNRLFMVLALFVFAAAFSGCDPCQENMLTKIGDSIATLGKSGTAKDQILAERAANRAAKCAESKAGEAKKKFGF